MNNIKVQVKSSDICQSIKDILSFAVVVVAFFILCFCFCSFRGLHASTPKKNDKKKKKENCKYVYVHIKLCNEFFLCVFMYVCHRIVNTEIYIEKK